MTTTFSMSADTGDGPAGGAMTPLELWHHQLTMAAARLATAVRTEDRDTVAAVLATELARRPPPGGVDVVTGLLLALSIQVPDDVPLRERVAWSLDIDLGIELGIELDVDPGSARPPDTDTDTADGLPPSSSPHDPASGSAATAA